MRFCGLPQVSTSFGRAIGKAAKERNLELADVESFAAPTGRGVSGKVLGR
jgi:hypothetical protein